MFIYIKDGYILGVGNKENFTFNNEEVRGVLFDGVVDKKQLEKCKGKVKVRKGKLIYISK